METIDVLIEAVAAFKGAIVIVSHDQFFLSRVGKGMDTWQATTTNLTGSLQSSGALPMGDSTFIKTWMQRRRRATTPSRA
jgi:ATPase subunit of ABC transporter with duplicated ATPase domains